MSRSNPAVWVARQDGSVSSQNIPARQLLGDRQGTNCWDLHCGLAGARGFACSNDCVRKLLQSGIDHSRQTAVEIQGQRRHLSCIPMAEEVLCVLSHAAGETPRPWQTLTTRERDVLELLALGETSASAARTLGLSESTVRTHVEKMLTKLDASNRASLVANGFRLGYLT